LRPGLPLTALAPMQDVTDLAFFGVSAHYGAPDYFFTEFFRVHATSRLEDHIVRSITENPSGRPVFAQLIGESLPDLARAAADLLKLPIAGIDLNLGCPAPKIYRKNVGGGLHRDLAKIDAILATLRAATPGLFTVKTRIGFDDGATFDALLELVAKHNVDLLSVHCRSVKELYRGEPHYEFAARAVARLRCPVLANGEVSSAAKAAAILKATGCAGLMVGRHAIRNPWIFRQIREHFAGETVFAPTLADVRGYIDRLHHATCNPAAPEFARTGKLKKYLNFIAQSVDPDGAFLRAMRHARTESELFAVCDEHLLREPSKPFAAEPYPGVVARPNCELPLDMACT
jgi:tRNA-dihydrouridine synthase